MEPCVDRCLRCQYTVSPAGHNRGRQLRRPHLPELQPRENGIVHLVPAEVTAWCYGWEQGRLPEDSGVMLLYKPQTEPDTKAWENGKQATEQCGYFLYPTETVRIWKEKADHGILETRLIWDLRAENPGNKNIAKRADDELADAWSTIGLARSYYRAGKKEQTGRADYA